MNPIAQALQSMGQGAFKSLIYDDEKKKLFPSSLMSYSDNQGDLFKQYKAGQLTKPNYINQAVQADSGLIGGLTGGVGKKIPKIPLDDVQAMERFIDEVRLRKPKVPQVGIDASRIAEHYGFKMPKTNSGLANVFDDVISRMYSNKK